MNYADFITEKYLGKDTPAGDLAGDIRHDPNFPRLTDQDPDQERQTIKNYLEHRSACAGCMAAFRYTWSRYIAFCRKEMQQ